LKKNIRKNSSCERNRNAGPVQKTINASIGSYQYDVRLFPLYFIHFKSFVHIEKSQKMLKAIPNDSILIVFSFALIAKSKRDITPNRLTRVFARLLGN